MGPTGGAILIQCSGAIFASASELSVAISFGFNVNPF